MAATFKLSTGARNKILTTSSIKSVFDGAKVYIYSNSTTAPASADTAIGSAVLLCVLSNGGAGITFDANPISGILSKTSTENWTGDILANGTASFFRIQSDTDDGTSSTTASRMQGSIGLINADFLVRDLNFVLGEEQRIDSCNLGLPESA